MAQVDVEIHEIAIFLQCDEVGDVQAGVGEKIELALQVKVQKTFDRGVRSDDAGVKAGVLSKFFVFLPMLVATALGSGERERKSRLVAFYSWMQNGIGEKFGGKRREFLAIVVVEGQIQADAIETDLDAVVGIVAKIHFDRQNPGGVRRLLGKS